LHDLRHALLARGVVQLDLAHRGQAILERAGVRSIPLKGAAVAEAYYPSVADRPMGDVDLLALDDWATAATALRREGVLDVEAADHACASAMSRFLSAGRRGRLGAQPAGQGPGRPGPAVEDLLIHLALHAAFQHGLALSLVQYADFRRVLQQTPPDPDRLLARATAARAEAPLASPSPRRSRSSPPRSAGPFGTGCGRTFPGRSLRGSRGSRPRRCSS
jgi:hypothetical protein